MVEGHGRTPTDCNYSFSFHILNLNINELVPVKGRMKVVPSNSVSIGSWYYQDLGARRPKTRILQVNGLSTGPPEIGSSRLNPYL